MRVVRTFVVLAFANIVIAAMAQAQMSFTFASTDVGDVLRAISMKTGASIVYSSQETIPITISVKANSVEDAVRSVSAAAGLMYKRIAGHYVVASATNMRRALEPYGQKAYLTVSGPSAAEAAKQLEELLPWLTARAAGTQVLAIGDPMDIEEARRQIPGIEARYRMSMRVNDVVFLKFATASQIAGMIKNMFPGVNADAFGPADKPGGGVGLSGPRMEVESARDMILAVDQPMAAMQPDMEYRVYHIKYSSAPVLKAFVDGAGLDVMCVMGPEAFTPPLPSFRSITGATLSSSNSSGSGGLGTGGSGGAGGVNQGGAGAGVGGGSGGFGQSYQRPHKEGDEAKTLVLRGTKRQLDRVFALLAEVDLKPIQVMVEVKVVDASPEKAEELGIKWSWSRFGFYELPPGTAVGDPTLNATRPAGFGIFSRVPFSFDAILGAMITTKDAKLLANPRIQVTDNDEASIFIGNTVRARIAQASGLGAQTVQIVEFPIGIILLIRPRVNADGNISMRIHPVVSTITEIDEDNIPQTSSREAETNVVVKDGETMVIGGLISEEITKTLREVPLLSQLPLVGELFKHRSSNKRSSEIIVVITPRIVRDASGSEPNKEGSAKEKGK